MDWSDYEPRPLRYRFGEQLLGEWSPRLAMATLPLGGSADGRALRHDLPLTLPRGVDGLMLRNVPADDFPIGIRRCGPYVEYVPRHDALYLVDVAGSFKDYLAANFSAKARQNLARSARRVAAMAGDGPAWTVYTAESDMPEFLRQAAAISARTYQQLVLKAGLEDDAPTRQMMCAEARAGNARGYLLHVEGAPAAFAWCRVVGRRLVYDTIGFDTAHGSHSPGNVLLYFLLEDVFASGGFDCVDFGPGEAAYKAMFSTRKVQCVDVYFVRAGPLNTLRVALHRGLFRTSVGLSHLLGRLGIKKQLKALVRLMHGAR